MKAKDLKEVIRGHLRSGSGKNELGSIFIEGPPGIGKSEIVAEVAKEENAECIDFRLLLRDPSDLLGIPYPDLATGTAKWLAPSELPIEGNTRTGDTGILFFDDMTTAPPLMQATAYQILIAPHKLGEGKLKEGWVAVGAGNRMGDKALTHAMPKPLANRFTSHISLEVDKDDWINWAVQHDINSSIIGFMYSTASTISTGHLLFQFDPKKDEKAFPTPRTWAKTSRILAEKFSQSIETELITGCIGAGAASQFSAFLRLFDKLPDINEIIEKRNFAITPTTGNMDIKYALVVAVAQGSKTKTHITNAVEWATSHLEPEFGMVLIKILGKTNKELLHSKALVDWAKKHRFLWS